MLDISNKLHALVDEFVSNLSSECNSLAHIVSSQGQSNLGHDVAPEIAPSQRPSNRTAAEVLNGLKRPSGVHVTPENQREGKAHMSNTKPKLKEGFNKRSNGGTRSQTVEVLSSDHSSDECPRPKPVKFQKKLAGNQRGRRQGRTAHEGAHPGQTN